MQISSAHARNMLLAAQGMVHAPKQAASKTAVHHSIQRMGVLQIDTIHVVARSPYLVLWSRLGNYDPQWLDQLLAEKLIFECWAHEASFVPIEDYRLFRHRMLKTESLGWRYNKPWVDQHLPVVERVLQHIRENGPTRSVDFERTDGIKGQWWDWKEEKRALEALFARGDLMIAERQRFQRVYDLRERILPSWDDTQLPSDDEVTRIQILKSVKAMGISTARWIPDYFRMRGQETSKHTKALIAEGQLLPVQVEGWPETAYILPEDLPLLEQLANDTPTHTTLLSPFDPVVWDRKRASTMFGFDYRIECYTPEPKRIYGYFTLPILHRGALIGRLDPKAHRKEGIFEVKALHLEPNIALNERDLHDLARTLRDCAHWHGTPQVRISKANQPDLAQRLQQACDALPSN
jgi:uncharacterized protein YcaQ